MHTSGFLMPSRDVLSRLLGAGDGTVRMVTLAPELPAALPIVHELASLDVVVSIGHTDAGYGEVEAAVGAGARSATHLFNAMRPLHHREPGAVGAMLDFNELSCELICDGVHVDPAALRLAWRAKGTAGVRLVTDAMQAAGMPDGSYRLGSASVEVRSGRTRSGTGEVIAGSTLTMDVALRNAVRFLRVPVVDASAMASQNPARVLGIERRKGAIAAGLDADLVVLDDSLHVCATMVEGGWVSEAPV
jgi:N-acetylglucosamine-6-phosphate deacetylase